MFVILDMELEQQMKRISGRHEGNEDAVEMMKVNVYSGRIHISYLYFLHQAYYKLCEPKAEDEPNAVDMKITPEMTREDVVEKIMQMVN